MAELVNQSKIPSGSTGELYDVAEYDDGTVTCSCAFGFRRGPMTPTGRSCKHVKTYRAQKALGFEPDVLPVALTDNDLDFDRPKWVRSLCYTFAPVTYLLEVVEATLRQDNNELDRLSKSIV